MAFPLALLPSCLPFHPSSQLQETPVYNSQTLYIRRDCPTEELTQHPLYAMAQPVSSASPGLASSGAQAGFGGPDADTGMSGEDQSSDYGLDPDVRPRIMDPAAAAPKAVASMAEAPYELGKR